MLGSPAGGTYSVPNPYNNSFAGNYPYTYSYTNASHCSGSARSTITVNSSVITKCGGTTYTLGAWKNTKGSAGPWLTANFATKFPLINNFPCTGGILIGSGARTVRLTTIDATRAYIAGTGTPAMLPLGNTCNPSGGNTLASQTIAAMINVVLTSNLGGQTYLFAPCLGMTVNQIIAGANTLLGRGAFNGMSLSDMTTVLNNINSNYDGGSSNLGYLGCPNICSPIREENNSVITPATDGSDFTVYPNPASSLVTVDFISGNTSNYLIKLVDVTGRVVISESNVSVEGENYIQLNVSNLSKGIYMISVQKDNSTSFKKVIVQ